MSEDFLPVSDDPENMPDASETGFVEGTVDPYPVSIDPVAEGVETAQPVEEGVEVPTLQIRPAQPSFGEQVRRWFSGVFVPLADRIAAVDRAIETAPEAAGNYVLRGELYFESREYELAQMDFEHALELAQAEYEASAWGLVAQSVQDRAVNGLQKTARKLGKRAGGYGISF